MNNNSTLQKVFGVYQTVGGLIALSFGFFILNSNAQKNTEIYIFIFMILNIYSIISGIFAISNLKNWVTVSLINQLLQCIYISSSTFAFSYAAGFELILKFRNAQNFIGLEYGISTSELFLGSQDTPFTFGVNIFALLLSILLIRIANDTEVVN